MKTGMSLHFDRLRAVQKIRSMLVRDSFPRLQMFLLVALTGAAGFIASYSLLHAGLAEMWSRYLASFAIAYLVFLALLWLWLRTRADDYVDLADLPGSPPSSSGSGNYSGLDGEFGGGGASGSYEEVLSDMPAIGGTDSLGETLGSAAEAEELAIPLIVLALIGTLLLSFFYMIYSVIYSAPILFAELAVDGLLSASLYHRLRKTESSHWLKTALRRTAWPFALTAAIVSACGWGMSHYAPEAHSIGEVVLHAKQAGPETIR